MEEILFFILIPLVGVYLMWSLIKLVFLVKLCRAIYVADKTTNFIKNIEAWAEKNQQPPFKKGIDPYDVFATLQEARMDGAKSIDKELKKEGDINEL